MTLGKTLAFSGLERKVLPAESGSPSLGLTTPSPSGPPDGSAVFRGCVRRPDNLSLALPVTAAMPNMSVDKCVDFCTEKVRRGLRGGSVEWLEEQGAWLDREVMAEIHDMGEGHTHLPQIRGVGVPQGCFSPSEEMRSPSLEVCKLSRAGMAPRTLSIREPG